MTSGRLTWLQDSWNAGELVDDRPSPRWVTRYGSAAARIVDQHRRDSTRRNDGPRGPDIQRSLRAIEQHGRAAIGRRWGFTLTESLLLRESYRLYYTEHYRRLPDEALRQCARAARIAFSTRPGSSGGRPPTDSIAISVVRELDSLWWRELRQAELRRMRQLEQRSYPAVPARLGKAVPSELQRLEIEHLKLLRRALRACGIRGLSDSNIERLLNEPAEVSSAG